MGDVSFSWPDFVFFKRLEITLKHKMQKDPQDGAGAI